MSPWVIWLLVLATLTVVAMVRVGVHAFYENDALTVYLCISKVKVPLLGGDKLAKEKKKKKKIKGRTITKETANQKPKASVKQTGKWKPWLDAWMEYWHEILALIGRVLTTPVLDILRLEIQVGGKDAEVCAMTYGRICGIIGSALPELENTFGIRKQKIEILCCFEREDLKITSEIAITVRVYEVFALVFALLGLGIKLFLQAKNNMKAVQVYESSSS